MMISGRTSSARVSPAERIGAPVGGGRIDDPKTAPLVSGSSTRTKIASPSMP